MSKKAIALIVVNSFSTLIRKRGGHSAIEFLRVLVARSRQTRCLSLLTMNRKAFHPAIVASAQDVADGVIELRTEERLDEIVRSIRIPKMTGVRHSTAWLSYEILDNGAFVSKIEPLADVNYQKPFQSLREDEVLFGGPVHAESDQLVMTPELMTADIFYVVSYDGATYVLRKNGSGTIEQFEVIEETQ